MFVDLSTKSSKLTDNARAIQARYYKGHSTSFGAANSGVIQLSELRHTGKLEIKDTAPTLTSQNKSGDTQPLAVMAVPLKFLDRNQKNYQGEYSFTVDTVNTGGVMIEVDTKVKREYNGDNDTVQTQQSKKEMSALSKDFNSKAVQQPTGGIWEYTYVGYYCDWNCMKGINPHRWKKKVLKWEGNYRARQIFQKTGVCEILQKEKTDRDTSQGRNKLNNNMTNLQEICRSCHTKHHQTKARKLAWKKRKRNKKGYFV